MSGPIDTKVFRYVTVPMRVRVCDELGRVTWPMQDRTFKVKIDFEAAAKTLGKKAIANASGQSIDCGGALIVRAVQL